jgi:hypothetical protein
MEKIIVDDRTAETPEQKLQREVHTAGELLVGFTMQITGARPSIGLGALAFALGMGGARTGASLDQIMAAVRHHYVTTIIAMQGEALELDEEDLEDLDDDDDDEAEGPALKRPSA